MAKPFIATQKINIGTALGYVPGDVVADDVVERFDLAESVAREGTKAATDAQQQPVNEPATGISDQLPTPG